MAQAAKHVVNDRRKSTAIVLRLARRHARSTARELRALLGPVLAEGEEMPDVLLLQRLMAAALEQRLRGLVDADAVLRDLVREDGELRSRRGVWLRKLYREIGRLRSAFAGMLGRDRARIYLALRGETSRNPLQLLRQAGFAAERLRRSQPAAELLGEGHHQRWAELIAETADALRPADRQASLSAKSLDLARLDRRRALAEFNELFLHVAGWFEATYRAVGRDDLADLVRPSKQYPGRTHREMQQPPDPELAETTAAGRLLSFKPLRRVVRSLERRRRAG